MLNFDPQTTHEPLKRSSPNLACVITLWIHPITKKKNWDQSVKVFLLPTYAKYTPQMFATVRYAVACLLLFWFFQSPTAETPALILPLNMSDDVVPHKNDSFDSYKNEMNFWENLKKIPLFQWGNF